MASKKAAKSEATLQSEIAMFLRLAPMNLSDQDIQELTLEAALDDGTRRRIDIEVANCIIEVKRDLAKTGVLREAEAQLAGYMVTQNEKRGVRHSGILTDGKLWRLYRLEGSLAVSVSAHDVATASPDVDSLIVWLETILATQEQIKPTPTDIKRFLGVDSNTYKLDHEELQRLYNENSANREIQLKKHLWARLLRTALGTSFVDDAALFVDHSLLVLEASVIAHAVMGVDLAAVDPAQVVSGELFRESQLYNVIENDFFDWVSLVPGGDIFVRELVRKVRRFAWADVEHDVLKVLYESVINTTTRKNLGEYYTPDWLAARVIAETVDQPLEQRVLDPACGSGTFLFHAIRHHIAEAESAGMKNAAALESVQSHVFGMDIHPVSVVLARVTYLLAIGVERLAGDRSELTVPVYLGDSMQWGSHADTIRDAAFTVSVDSPDLASDERQQTLFSTGEQLAFPLSTISDGRTFDRLVSELAALAHTHTDPKRRKPNPSAILNSYGIAEDGDRSILTSTFQLLCSLNADNRDHIWGYFVRNQVRPLWFSFKERQVDVLVGNPPWVAYRYMTAAMQKKFKRFSENRNLWAGGAVATQQDLVGLFIARSVEQFLRPEGKFGFVTPKAVLTRQQYAGLRSGKWATNIPSTVAQESISVRVRFDQPWDLQAVRPAIFPVPSAVVFGQRVAYGEAMPKTATRFSGLVSRRATSTQAINESLSTDETLLDTHTADDGSASPYGKTVFQGATVVPRFLFCVTRQASGPLGHARGIVPVASLRTSLEKPPWKTLPSLTGNVESSFLHKMHLGSTVAHFRLLEPWLTVLPISDGKLLNKEGIAAHKNLSQWWNSAASVWEAKKSPASKLTLMQQLDFQGKLKKQLGKGPHRVVYSASGNRLVAAYVEDPSLIIEHKLYWLAVPSEAAAHYLTAVLNSEHVLDRVSKFQSQGLFGARDFDKYVWKLPIPVFMPSNDLHLELSALGREARDAAATVPVEGVSFQKGREAIRQELASRGISQQLESLVGQLMP